MRILFTFLTMISLGLSHAQVTEEVKDSVRASLLKTRAEQIGKKYESLTLGDRKFETVTIMAIDDTGLKISHSGGMATVYWNHLQPMALAAFGFDNLAFADLVAEKKRQDEARKAMLASPEFQEAQAKDKELADAATAKMSQEQKDAEIALIGAEIVRGKDALAILQAAKAQLEKKYAAEDKKAAYSKMSRSDSSIKDVGGGIRTSQPNRDKALAIHNGNIAAAARKLAELERRLAELQAN